MTNDESMKKFDRWNRNASIIMLLIFFAALAWAQYPDAAFERLFRMMDLMCFLPGYCGVIVVVLFNNPHWKNKE